MYKILVSNKARKEFRYLKQSPLLEKFEFLIEILKNNPLKYPPDYEKLENDLAGYYSRRLNKQHRLVYKILPNTEHLVDENNVEYEGIVKILRMWTHYE
ncbi:MAG: Txe/YoeB family addiction module toxin [Firmicutes bacterium]|nr:Txe/YoeB family addiction module toxin [Bacillota bacterium]